MVCDGRAFNIQLFRPCNCSPKTKSLNRLCLLKKKPTSHYFHCKVEAALPTSIQSQVLKITQSDLAGAAGALYSWSTPKKLG